MKGKQTPSNLTEITLLGTELFYVSSDHEVRIDLAEVSKNLRQLQLYVQLLNIVNRNLIFTWKLLSLGGCIICGYAAIAHFHEQPIFGIMYYVVCLDGTLLYAIVYQKVFQVPAKLKEAKVAILAQSVTRNYTQIGWNAERRQIMSIPAVGIQVGEFHTLERASTPSFLHFVLTNIVNMLVAFK